MKILIVRLSSLGDLFLAMPAVHNLKAGLDAEIHWVAHTEYVDLVRCFSDVSRVIPFYRRGFLGNLNRFLSDLRSEEYDCVVDLQGLFKSGLVTALARARRKIGPSFHREGARVFYSEIAGPQNRDRHAVEQCLDAVRLLGLKRTEVQFPVVFPRANMAEARPRIAVLPASRWPTKTWPGARFIELITLLKKEKRFSLFLIGSNNDVPLCRRIEEAAGGGIVNMAGKSTLPQTGGLLSEMDLLIANDSGPVHMAAAVGTPCLALFGPTDPSRTGPWGARHRVIQTSLSCRPCLSRRCKVGGIPCMTGITPEEVARAALEMLDGV